MMMLLLLQVLLLLLSFRFHNTNVHALALQQQLPRTLDAAIERGLLVELKLPKHNNSCCIYILGTVHIGDESANEATILINAVRPSIVIVEMSPSRLEEKQKLRIRQIRQQQQQAKSEDDVSNKKKKKMEDQQQQQQQARKNEGRTRTPGTILFDTIPQLAMKGWEHGGFGGLLFSAGMIGGTLLKQSLMNNGDGDDDNDNDIRHRYDEFEATIIAANNNNNNNINATTTTSIVAADYEFEELIKEVSDAMTPCSWLRIFTISILENIGLYPKDPIVRQRDETYREWKNRRRNITTARASRIHGDKTCYELSQILVTTRDERFAKCCIEAILQQQQQRQQLSTGFIADNNTMIGDGDGDEDPHGKKKKKSDVIVCVVVVGLVHVDGIVRRIIEQQQHF